MCKVKKVAEPKDDLLRRFQHGREYSPKFSSGFALGMYLRSIVRRRR